AEHRLCKAGVRGSSPLVSTGTNTLADRHVTHTHPGYQGNARRARQASNLVAEPRLCRRLISVGRELWRGYRRPMMFHTTVFLPVTYLPDIEAGVALALAPYDARALPPDEPWELDWWRMANLPEFLRVKPEYAAEIDDGTLWTAPKFILDLDAMRDAAAAKAA